MVDLQEICLQHRHLFVPHLEILGYTLRVLKGRTFLYEEFEMADFKGDRITFGPLLKHLLIEMEGT